MSTQDKAAPICPPRIIALLQEVADDEWQDKDGVPLDEDARTALALIASTQQAEPPRRLSPYDAVAEAMRLASLMGGSIGMSDVEKTRAYESRLRSHLIEFIYPLESATAKAAIEQRSHELLREWIAKGAELHSKVKPRQEGRSGSV